MHEIERREKILAAKPTWNPHTIPTEFSNHVVIIGESARRDALHAYQFNIENTPFLSSTPRIQFENYISASGNTETSLTHTFILDYINAAKDNPPGNNIVNLANAAGFKTYWLSNQLEIGIYDSFVSGIGKHASYNHFLNYSMENPTKDDFHLIPVIQEALRDEPAGQSKKVIFVHITGSHSPFCDRTNNQYDDFFINEKMSCYVQSIKKTDALLEKIHDLLQENKQQTGKEWAMVYFSDHGLSYDKNDTQIMHHDKYQTNVDVPFLILNSKLTETTHIKAQRSGFNFFDFFGDWLGIQDNLLPNECNFVSEEPCPNSEQMVNFSKQVVKYNALKKEKTDWFKRKKHSEQGPDLQHLSHSLSPGECHVTTEFFRCGVFGQTQVDTA